MDTLLMVLFAYLLGSVPTGFVLGWLSGVDVRSAGSGNIGATNVARVLGKRQGLATLAADVAKGFIPVFLSLQLDLSLGATSVVALAAFVGHLFPVFLRFRGGKGVATALGVLLGVGLFYGLAPVVTVLFVFFFVAMVSRVVSLASLATACLAPAAFWFFSYPAPLVGLSLLMALGIVLRHRENIRRLALGVEPKFEL